MLVLLSTIMTKVIWCVYVDSENIKLLQIIFSAYVFTLLMFCKSFRYTLGYSKNVLFLYFVFDVSMADVDV